MHFTVLYHRPVLTVVMNSRWYGWRCRLQLTLRMSLVWPQVVPLPPGIGYHWYHEGNPCKKCKIVRGFFLLIKGNICVILNHKKRKISQGDGGYTIVQNTYEIVVGTVHLVTKESFFVAKSSPPQVMLCVWVRESSALLWPQLIALIFDHLPQPV